MNKNTILIATITLGLGIISGLVYSQSQKNDYPPRNNQIPSNNMNHMGHMMSGSMHDMMMVKSERAFLEGMIPHHQEAIDTAKEVLARGATTPALKTLAQNIITAQEAEIASMKTWYQDWYNEPYQDKNTYMPMMRDLTTLSGAALDTVFLEDMIMHHMGAIMMAQSVEPHLEHQEMETLTTNIVTTQSAEIEQMKEILTTLPK
jgi:uncharacterized protein (DUF305 family)